MDNFPEGGLKFTKIIDPVYFQKLNDIEKFEHLIEKGILLKTKNFLDNLKFFSLHQIGPNGEQIDITNNFFQDEKVFNFPTLDVLINGQKYKLNKDLQNEYFEYLQLNIEDSHSSAELDFEILLIFNKIKNSINTSDKLKILNSAYNVHHYYFFNSEDYDIYLKSVSNDADYNDTYINKIYSGRGSWRSKIISNSNQELLQYVTNVPFFVICNSPLIKQWKKLHFHKKVMDYCKELINSLENKNGNSSAQKIETFETDEKKKRYYSLVFKGQNEENLFNETLEDINAIDKNSKARTRLFKPCCHAFLLIDKNLQNEIFKPNCLEDDFVNYLFENYPDGFNPKKKPRLSDGSNHKNTVQINLRKNISLLKERIENKLSD